MSLRKSICLLWSIVSLAAWAETNARSHKKQSTPVKNIGPSKSVDLPVLGIATPVLSRLDARHQRHPIGVLTRVCLRPSAYLNNRPAGYYTSFDRFYRAELWAKVPQDRGYAVTPSHVAQAGLEPGQSILRGLDGHEYHVEFLDSSGDLALLSYQDQGQPCGVLSEGLKVSMAYDVEAALLETPRQLEIEAPNLGLADWSLRRRSFQSLLAVTNEFALSGRDQSGPLLMAIAQGYRGQSGGALMGFQSPGGEFVDQATEAGTDAGHLRRVLGMILAVDSEGHRLVCLPGPTIVRKIRGFYGGYWKPIQSSIAVNGGTLYPEISAVHFRSWIDEAGVGTLADSGTGTVADSGTGTVADSGFPEWVHFRKGAIPSSGLLLKGQLWRELNDWTEFEPIGQDLRSALLQTDTPLRGVFETLAGQVSFVSPTAMNLAEPNPPLSPGLLLSRSEADQYLSPQPILLADDLPCSWISGVERVDQSNLLNIRPFLYCDGYQASRRLQTRLLAWQNASTGSIVNVLRFDYRFECAEIQAQVPCALAVSVKHYQTPEVANGQIWTLSAESYQQARQAVPLAMMSTRSAVTDLKPLGLRYATAKAIHAGLFLSGGFRVRLALANRQVVTLVGPGQSGLLNYRRELLIDPEHEK